MVIDTSAIVAMADEPPRLDPIEDDPMRLLSAANLLDTALVVEARWGEPGGRELDSLLHRATVDTVAVTADHVQIARRAWRGYGKDRDPAALNFGDCFGYALAASSGEPLLFVGSDFSKTDIPAVGQPA